MTNADERIDFVARQIQLVLQPVLQNVIGLFQIEKKVIITVCCITRIINCITMSPIVKGWNPELSLPAEKMESKSCGTVA